MTEQLLSVLLTVLSDAVQNVDTIIQSYSSTPKETVHDVSTIIVKGSIWKQDQSLEASINQLKNITAVITQSVIKFSMLFSSICDKAMKNNSCTMDHFGILDSLIDELQAQVVTIVTFFLGSSAALRFPVACLTSHHAQSGAC
jgi:hypothetical protein